MSTSQSRNINLLAVGYGVIALMTIGLVAVMIYFGLDPAMFIGLPLYFILFLYAAFSYLQLFPFYGVVALIWAPAVIGAWLLVRYVSNRLEGRLPRFIAWGIAGAATIYVLVSIVLAAQFVDTEYAPGYSEAAFDSIQIGDSEEKVLAVLGEPIDRVTLDPSNCGDCTQTMTFLAYSHSPSSASYVSRVIVIDDAGRVIEIRHEVYWD
jgi:hypothetical protein